MRVLLIAVLLAGMFSQPTPPEPVTTVYFPVMFFDSAVFVPFNVCPQTAEMCAFSQPLQAAPVSRPDYQPPQD